jgi:sugar lactone lactonase YvrE
MTLDRFGYDATVPHSNGGLALEVLSGPAALIGANGMRAGPDQRLYVAQAFGNQISAIDLQTGIVGIVSPADGMIVAPDDLAFDSHGELFATEVMSARVTAIAPNGKTRLIASDVPVANGITVHSDRIYMSEFRPDGRILELSAAGTAPRVVAEGLMMPNALNLGPDGCLYFPLVPLGEIWRVAPDGGVPERVAGGFDIPTAVKFAPDGALVIVESGSGTVTRLDIRTGQTVQLARTAFGIDNLEFTADGRLFISHFTNGAITEIQDNGATRVVVQGGMSGPFGLAAGKNGELIVADGMSLAIIDPSGNLERPSMLLQHGFPGYVRGIAATASGLVCTNSAGAVLTYTPGEEAIVIAADLDRVMAVAVAANGDIVVCEAGAGRVLSIDGGGNVTVLARGLSDPTGLCINREGTIFVSEAGAGRVTAISNGEAATVVDGLSQPHGLACDGRQLFILDRDARTLLRHVLDRNETIVLATGLPTGPGTGRKINSLPGIANLMPGPLLPFADLAVLPDGRLCISCDGDGSIRTLALRC